MPNSESLDPPLPLSSPFCLLQPQGSLLTSRQALAVKQPDSFRVLLVEDCLINQKVIAKQLEILGYTTDVVADGQTAIAAFIQFPYDLILMDCHLPEIDGFEATIAIRHHEQELRGQRHRTVIIALSASELRQDQERAMAVGMDDYLSKPIPYSLLANCLKQWSQPRATIHPVIPQAVSAAAPTLLPHLLDLDLEQLHHLSDADPAFELELLQLFVEDCRAQFQLLEQAIVLQDFQQIRQFAHRLRGASANIGAQRMEQLAEELEKQAQQQIQISDTALQTWLTNLTVSLNQIQLYIEQKR